MEGYGKGYMQDVLIEGKDLNKHGRSVWRGRGGGSSAVAIPLGNIPRGNEVSETKDIDR